jgi:tRNA(Ile)-lysidine synthase
LKELNPLLSPLSKGQSYLQEAQSMVDDAAIMVYQQVAKQIDDQFILIFRTQAFK